MKKLLSILTVMMLTVGLLAADAANDLILTQRKADNSGNIQRNVAIGSAGQVLTSNGAGAAPSMQAGGGGAAYELKITYTGTPQTALVLPLVPGIAVVPVAAVGGQATYTAAAGPTIAGFSYSEGNLTTGNRLLTLNFDDLAGVSGSFSPGSMTALTALQANALVIVGLNFSPATLPALTTLEANSLVTVANTFGPNAMAVLTTMQFNSLVGIGGGFSPNTMALLTTMEANSLVRIGTSFAPSTMASLVTLSFPALTTIGTTFAPVTMAACTTVSLPAMVSYGSTIAIPSASMGNVAAFTMGTVGTLKSIAGATITLSGLKLPSSEVNAILALLVSLDGTNGTTLWGTGKTLTINGGTNGAPTGQGATDKTTLQARGATITTN